MNARLLYAATLALGLGAGSSAFSQTTLTAHDEGNGEILLEWQAQPNAVSYRVDRMMPGGATISLEAGDGLNVMDFGGLNQWYGYKLYARAADGTDTLVSTLAYKTPAYMLSRVAAVAGKAPQLRSAVGTNLNSITYYSTEVPFVDIMKSASAWVSGDATTWDNGQALALDANGWVQSLAPGQIARSTLLVEHYPAGTYLVRYKGQGTLQFGDAAAVIDGSQAPGSLLIQLTPGNVGLYMQISDTNPADYLRDIQIIMPGGICEGDPFTYVADASGCTGRFLSFAAYSRSIIFYPVFLNQLRNYSVLRFMDWMKTNGNGPNPNPVLTWTDRTPLSYRTWTKDSGAPIEVMIALANKVGAHPWFNVPHQADDTYVQNFATAVKGRLDGALGLYVEYSNEVWNAIFPQHAYAIAQGALQTPPIDGVQYHALRSRAVGKLFDNTVGLARAVTVLGAQAGNTWTATHALDYLNATFGTSAMGIEAVAIAPYFAVIPDPTTAPIYDAMTLDAFFDYVSSQLMPLISQAMQNYHSVASTYGVKLISYEGGQHMVGVGGAENDATLNALFDAFNRDPRIKQTYLDYLADWKADGGHLFMHYPDISHYDKFGRWGALEYVSESRDQAPKFDALQTFITLNPVWWPQ